MSDDEPDAIRCRECGERIDRCDESQHIHDWYDHVGGDHMCRWCLLSEYDDDPAGDGSCSQWPTDSFQGRLPWRVRLAAWQLRLRLRILWVVASPGQRAAWRNTSDDD